MSVRKFMINRGGDYLDSPAIGLFWLENGSFIKAENYPKQDKIAIGYCFLKNTACHVKTSFNSYSFVRKSYSTYVSNTDGRMNTQYIGGSTITNVTAIQNAGISAYIGATNEVDKLCQAVGVGITYRLKERFQKAGLTLPNWYNQCFVYGNAIATSSISCANYSHSTYFYGSEDDYGYNQCGEYQDGSDTPWQYVIPFFRFD